MQDPTLDQVRAVMETISDLCEMDGQYPVLPDSKRVYEALVEANRILREE